MAVNKQLYPLQIFAMTVYILFDNANNNKKKKKKEKKKKEKKKKKTY